MGEINNKGSDQFKLVRVNELTKSYQMGEVTVTALRNLSLSIQQGEFVVILGPSGSGKTTLLNMIGGLDTPSSGNIIVKDQHIENFNRKQLTNYRKSTVGFVFQFYNLIPNLNARENVEFAIELVGVEMENGIRSKNKKKIREKALELLRTVGLKDRNEHFPAQLSGGEQQRVAIARALAKDPPLIIADEPTGNLDYESARQVLMVLHHLTKQSGKTILIVTHNSAIARSADRNLKLRDGQIVEDHYNASPLPIEQIKW